MPSYSELVAAEKARRASLAPGTLEPTQPGGANGFTVGGGDDFEGDDTDQDDRSGYAAEAELGDTEDELGRPDDQMPTKVKVGGDIVTKDAMDYTHFAKAEKIEHGVVFGWAIICKEAGVDYYDLNRDPYTGQPKPDHIPEHSMLDAACDFAKDARPGNDMHAGPEAGQYLFLFPMTTDIAKALGITTPKTGLLVGYKPPPDILAKFESGEYTGFSIEGARVTDKEIP